MKDPQKLQEELRLRKGANAIYMEPDFIAYFRVCNVRADDWGINALITVLPTPRMRDEGEPSYEISAAWNIFSNYNDHWHASYVNWSVYFGAEEVKAGLDVAALAADRGSPRRASGDENCPGEVSDDKARGGVQLAASFT